MTSVAELVRLFLGWNAEHRAAATVKHYRSRLAPFVARFGSRSLAELSPLELEAYLADAARNPDGALKAPDTRRANATVLEVLQRWAAEHGEIERPILARIEKPAGRLRERLPTEAETAAILGAASAQFALIYRALRHSGARPGELARATVGSYDREAGLITLAEHKTARKTGKPRRIGVGVRLAAIIDESLSGRLSMFAGLRNVRLKPGTPLFVSPRGKPWTTASIGDTFRRLRDRLGLPRDLVVYLARHEHATVLCDKLGIQAAAEALNHANIQTTRRYIKTDVAALRRNQDAFG